MFACLSPSKKIGTNREKRDEELKDCFVVNESKESKENKSFLGESKKCLGKKL